MGGLQGRDKVASSVGKWTIFCTTLELVKKTEMGHPGSLTPEVKKGGGKDKDLKGVLAAFSYSLPCILKMFSKSAKNRKNPRGSGKW